MQHIINMFVSGKDSPSLWYTNLRTSYNLSNELPWHLVGTTMVSAQCFFWLLGLVFQNWWSDLTKFNKAYPVRTCTRQCCRLFVWWASVFHFPLSSSCSMPDCTHAVPLKQAGKWSGNPQAAIPRPPDWGHLTSSTGITSHFHYGCKDLKGWHSPIHPNIRIWFNPCGFGSYAVKPDAHMHHWQGGHCVSSTEMYQEWRLSG